MDLPYVYDYNGEHSVRFQVDGVWKDTWTDWGLIPSSRHSEPVRALWSQAVAINGTNGQEDLLRKFPYFAVNSYAGLREALVKDNREQILSERGYDIFQPLSGSLSFIIADQTVPFMHKKQEILSFLHGKTALMQLTDDPDKTYTVFVSVDSVSSGDSFSQVSITYSVTNET